MSEVALYPPWVRTFRPEEVPSLRGEVRARGDVSVMQNTNASKHPSLKTQSGPFLRCVPTDRRPGLLLEIVKCRGTSPIRKRPPL